MILTLFTNFEEQIRNAKDVFSTRIKDLVKEKNNKKKLKTPKKLIFPKFSQSSL